MEKSYYNALRGAYYYPVVSRHKQPMRPGKTERDRAKRSGQTRPQARPAERRS